MSTFWLEGIELFLKSDTTRLIYRHLKAEEVHAFLSEALMDPILNMKSQDNLPIHYIDEIEGLE